MQSAILSKNVIYRYRAIFISGVYVLETCLASLFSTRCKGMTDGSRSAIRDEAAV